MMTLMLVSLSLYDTDKHIIRQVMCSNENEKYESLCNIYGTITIGQTMIFCKVCVLKLSLLQMANNIFKNNLSINILKIQEHLSIDDLSAIRFS